METKHTVSQQLNDSTYSCEFSDSILEGCVQSAESSNASESSLDQYLQHNYYDLSFFLNAITRNNPCGYFFFGDPQTNVYYISENLRSRFGYDSCIVSDFPNSWLERIGHKRSRQFFQNAFEDLKNEKQTSISVYHQITNAQGRQEWVHCCMESKWSPDKSKLLFCVGRINMPDLSLLVDQATNFVWESMLCRHLSYLNQSSTPRYILGISFNQMSRINSMLGRSGGDRLLRRVADVLSDRFGDSVIFYRLSGMRCAALIRTEYSGDYKTLAFQIREVIENEYTALGIHVPQACNLVLMKYPCNDLSAPDFIESLGKCIRTAQQSGCMDFVDNTQFDLNKTRTFTNMALALNQDVLDGMRNFRIVVQPVINVKAKKATYGEVLLRWCYQGKDIPPSQFIPLLEYENLMNQVGRWVFEQAVKLSQKLHSFKFDFHLSINLSLHQLDDKDLTAFFTDTLKHHEVNGCSFILELTESCMDKDPEKLMELVQFCNEQGILLALDDFGTGYSSLRVLMQYPTNIVKLDRSLLLEMEKSQDKLNFIAAIVLACHQFGKLVCVEGVETKEQLELAHKIQCNLIQGFYYHRPLEIPDLFRELCSSSQPEL